MGEQALFPKSLVDDIDKLCNRIDRLPCDLWDEATELLIQKLNAKAEAKHEYYGLRYLADIKDGIEEIQDQYTYTMVKKTEITGKVINV